ncbi:NAD(P)-binding protein [Rhizopogon vinicolor AM-OR11-026]|uniref:NAD(P)-binding protein n=1 Tax=Rhizopogon vinicolor AM-OR11-026 TaxID=1314800 RepID=A0A1B7N6K0_9AGAM|nr:NAD(P)-binding protein [Rhizopogon vinicolor AM-OR11-026]
MLSLSAARIANATHFTSSKSHPVALFVGGTSGIGEAAARAMARYTKGDSHIIICGRNREAADNIISSFPEHPQSQYEFVACDASLMRNVKTVTSDLLSRLQKLNYIVLSPGILTMRGRTETEEGIDQKLALHYYARWKFIHDLLPLLRKAKDAGEDAKVLTVLGAGRGGEIDLEDLGLKKNYTLAKAAGAAETYNDLMIEEFSSREPDLTFTHITPGVVLTPLLTPKQWYLKPFSFMLSTALRPFVFSADECAEYLLQSLLYDKSGAFMRGTKAQLLYAPASISGRDEARQKLWDHTLRSVDV